MRESRANSNTILRGRNAGIRRGGVRLTSLAEKLISTCCSRPKGQIAVVAALAVAVLLGAVALGTDVAVFYFNWAQLQKAADAAALAGASYLPSNPDLATSTAKDYAGRNGVGGAEIKSTTISGDKLQIQIALQRSVPYYFGRLLGLTSGMVRVSATAGVQATCSAKGLVPLGLQKGTVLTTYQDVILKLAPAQGFVGPGNWEPLALGGSGGSTYRDNLEFGYSSTVSVGASLATETGNVVGPTQQGINYRLSNGSSSDSTGTSTNHTLNDPRVIEIPIVDFNGINGKSQVPVYGFAELWIESVAGNGNITAQFITQVTADNNPGNCGSPIYGALAPVLMQ